ISLPMTLVHLTSTSILLSSCNDTALTEIYTLSLHDALPISQRLRRSIADYFDAPFYLWHVQAERLIDLRDEELALREEEALGELPTELEYESLQTVHEQISEAMQALLIRYYETKQPIELGELLRQQLERYPQSQHFDVARIIVDQAVKLGIASQDFSGKIGRASCRER